MQCPVVQHKGNVAHGQRCQRYRQCRGTQLLRNAACRYQQKYQSIHGQHCAVAQQQLADNAQNSRTDALKLRLCQWVIPQQEHEDQRHFLIRHKEQGQQADRSVGRQGQLHPALHADCCNKKARHCRRNEHGNGDHGTQQHQGDTQCRHDAAVSHAPAFLMFPIHGISQFSLSTPASSGSTA